MEAAAASTAATADVAASPVGGEAEYDDGDAGADPGCASPLLARLAALEAACAAAATENEALRADNARLAADHGRPPSATLQPGAGAAGSTVTPDPTAAAAAAAAADADALAALLRECVVCLDRDRAVVLLPCRHDVTCASCAAALPWPRRCPVCRAAITAVAPVRL